MPEQIEEKPHEGWKSSRLLRAAIIFFAVLIGIRFLWVARSVFLVSGLGIIFGLALIRPVDFLHRKFRLKRGIGAALLVFSIFGVLTLAGRLAAPAIRAQSDELRERLPKAVDQIEQWLGRNPEAAAVLEKSTSGRNPPATGSETGAENGGSATTSNPEAPAPEQQREASSSSSNSENSTRETKTAGTATSLRDQLAAQLSNAVGYLVPFLSSTFAVLAGLLLVVFVAIYIASEPELYRKGLMHLVPVRSRPRAREVLVSVAEVLRQWLVARLLAMLVIGAITFGVLLALQVRAAAILAIVAGMLEFIPFFGPILSALPAIGVALIDSPQKAAYVAIAWLVIQQIEGNVVTPLLLKNRVNVPPALTLIGVGALGVAFGLLGILIAEPLIAVALLLVRMLYVHDSIEDPITEQPAARL